MDPLPPARPLLGVEPTTQARALTGDGTLPSGFMHQCSTTERAVYAIKQTHKFLEGSELPLTGHGGEGCAVSCSSSDSASPWDTVHIEVSLSAAARAFPLKSVFLLI